METLHGEGNDSEAREEQEVVSAWDVNQVNRRKADRIVPREAVLRHKRETKMRRCVDGNEERGKVVRVNVLD